MVEEPPVPLRGEEPERDADRDREDHRRDRELDRRREPLPDLRRDLAPRRDADVRGRRCAVVLTYVQYCSQIGWLSPYCCLVLLDERRASRARRGAPPPGSPGSALIQKKMRSESPRRIGTSSSSRRTMNRSIFVVRRLLRSRSYCPPTETLCERTPPTGLGDVALDRSSERRAPGCDARTALPGRYFMIMMFACL